LNRKFFGPEIRKNFEDDHICGGALQHLTNDQLAKFGMAPHDVARFKDLITM
jgi:hypothetical protein